MAGDDLDILEREAEGEQLEPPRRRRPADLTGAARQRQMRARRACGQRVFHLTLDEDAAAVAVVDAGLLTEDQTADHGAVETALALLVSKLILP